MNADYEATLHRSEILPQVKSRTDLSSLRVSCNRALIDNCAVKYFCSYTWGRRLVFAKKQDYIKLTIFSILRNRNLAKEIPFSESTLKGL